MNATIRSYRVQDLGRVLRLWEAEGPLSAGDGLTVDQAVDLINAEGSVTLVAEEGTGDLVGVAVGEASVFGPPGTGKTTFAKGLASLLEWVFVEIQPGELASEGPDRQAQRLADMFDRVLALDPAVLRPSRFGYVLPVGPPDTEARRAIWQRFVEDITDEEVDFDALVEATERFTPADIEFVARKAAHAASSGSTSTTSPTGPAPRTSWRPSPAPARPSPRRWSRASASTPSSTPGADRVARSCDRG